MGDRHCFEEMRLHRFIADEVAFAVSVAQGEAHGASAVPAGNGAKAHLLSFIGLLAGLALALSCLLAAGCAGTGDDGVAASLLGHDIAEDEVTAYIDSFRNGMQLADDEAWARYLADADATPQELRETTIYELAVPFVIQAKADELGIAVDESAVESRANSLRKALLVEDDESWQNELALYGMSEDRLHENMANQNLREQVIASVAEDIVPAEDDVKAYAAEHLAGVGTKKIASVYGSDYGNVQVALQSIQQAPSVAEGVSAIAENPEERGVYYTDVGWDVNAELTSNMQNVISYLEKGEISDAPMGEGGTYYLFYIVDEYAFPEGVTELDLSDESLRQAVADLATEALKEAAGSVWVQQQIDAAITIRDMPSGLPYDVSEGGR